MGGLLGGGSSGGGGLGGLLGAAGQGISGASTVPGGIPSGGPSPVQTPQPQDYGLTPAGEVPYNVAGSQDPGQTYSDDPSQRPAPAPAGAQLQSQQPQQQMSMGDALFKGFGFTSPAAAAEASPMPPQSPAQTINQRWPQPPPRTQNFGGGGLPAMPPMPPQDAGGGTGGDIPPVPLPQPRPQIPLPQARPPSAPQTTGAAPGSQAPAQKPPPEIPFTQPPPVTPPASRAQASPLERLALAFLTMLLGGGIMRAIQNRGSGISGNPFFRPAGRGYFPPRFPQAPALGVPRGGYGGGFPFWPALPFAAAPLFLPPSQRQPGRSQQPPSPDGKGTTPEKTTPEAAGPGTVTTPEAKGPGTSKGLGGPPAPYTDPDMERQPPATGDDPLEKTPPSSGGYYRTPGGGMTEASLTAPGASWIESRGGHSAGTGAPNLQPEFASRLAAAGQAYEQETGQRAQFGEMGRSKELQAKYYEEYKRTGQGLAAPPGQSKHQRGLATDIPRGQFQDWMHRNASRFGIMGLRDPSDPNHFQINPDYTGRNFASSQTLASQQSTMGTAPTARTPAQVLASRNRGDINQNVYNRTFAGTPLEGQYGNIVRAAQDNGVPPSLMASIIAYETGRGRSNMLRTRNNPAGIAGRGGYQSFPTIEDGIAAAGRAIGKIYRQGGSTISGMARIYAPPGASNDPRHTNREWPMAVAQFQHRFGADNQMAGQ